MARRSDHSRDELRAMAIAAARDIIAREGYPALTARGVAREIGYSVGTIYNLFDDLDDLVVHVNGETFDQLYDDLSADRPALGLEQALLDIGRRYVAFVSANRGLWNAIFDHRMPGSGKIGSSSVSTSANRRSIFGAYQSGRGRPAGMRAERRRAAAMLWSSLHGLCTLWQSDKMRLVESAPLADLATAMISTFVAGLRAGTGQ